MRLTPETKKNAQRAAEQLVEQGGQMMAIPEQKTLFVTLQPDDDFVVVEKIDIQGVTVSVGHPL